MPFAINNSIVKFTIQYNNFKNKYWKQTKSISFFIVMSFLCHNSNDNGFWNLQFNIKKWNFNAFIFKVIYNLSYCKMACCVGSKFKSNCNPPPPRPLFKSIFICIALYLCRNSDSKANCQTLINAGPTTSLSLLNIILNYDSKNHP